MSGRRGGGRVDGIDVARGLAFVGMVLAHYAVAYRADDPGWLRRLDAAADGRAAPLFCLLLGVGASLLAAGRASDQALVRRGVALFALGAALWPLVDRVYVILPHYGVLLAAVPLLRRIPTAALLPVAAVAFVVPSTLTAVTDVDPLRSELQPDRYGELLDVVAVARYLVWTGGYPLAGWVGFALVGSWVSRLDLRRRATAAALVIGGAVVGVAQPAVDAAHHRAQRTGAAWAVYADAGPHSNHTAWYVLATATAQGALGACLLLASPARRLVASLRDLGRMALTAYVTHLGVGVVFVWPWQDTGPALVAQVLLALAVVAALALASRLWLARFGRGPLEAVLRAVAP